MILTLDDCISEGFDKLRYFSTRFKAKAITARRPMFSTNHIKLNIYAAHPTY